ncbi:SecDF P1 head subdomain-containing protein [Streptomyces sp. NPDC102270]|uniref:SecDF P1 head subdomain-containing protein n=1 Tax=Streptomyces sp. NPDC102270 TaxID=3366150 RepID=UPI003830DAEC
MNDSTEHPLHDALHAHVRENGADAGAQLAGLADGALRIARRRQRLARAGVGIVAAAAVATAWVAVADDAPPRANVIRPAAGDSTGNTGKAALLSLLPITSRTDQACKQGSGGYTVQASATHPKLCVRADRDRGMTDIQVTSAKAFKSSVDGTWRVLVTLDSTDRTRFAALTGSIAPAPAPRNGFAIVVDGKLWGMPYVNRSITGGRVEIAGAYSGDLTSAAVHDLAARLDPH